MTASIPLRARQFIVTVANGRLARQASWVLTGHVFVQAIRLITNVILARIIAPELFGIMLLVNTMRTGIELLSDVGIGQNVIRHRDGETAEFLNTAWTIQAARGALLMLVGLALAAPLSRVYHDHSLAYVFAACSMMFLIDGFISPGRFAFTKNQRVRELTLFECITATINAVVSVVTVWMLPSIWGLVTALLLNGVIILVANFWFLPLRSLSLRIDQRYFKEIIHFGKWIFLSSVVYFLSMNFDRLYLATAIPLAAFGVYGIARTLSDAMVVVANRVGGMMIFPKVANAHNEGNPLRAAIGRVRLRGMALVVAGLAPVIAVSDLIIKVLYDHRYETAAFILPILLIGAWFNMLATLADAVLLGIGKAGSTAAANAAKFAWMATATPLALSQASFTWALSAIASADFVRYIVLTVANRRHGLAFLRQDISQTAALLTVAFVIRSVLSLAGLTPTFAAWWALGSSLH